MTDSIFKFVVVVPVTVFYMLLVQVIYESKIVVLYVLAYSLHFYVILTSLDIFNMSLS